MVDVGYVPTVKSPWFNLPSGKIQNMREINPILTVMHEVMSDGI